MISPLNRLKTKEDIIAYMDNDDKLVYPILANIICIIGKIINPYEEKILMCDKNSATIVGNYVKQFQLFKEYVNAYKVGKQNICVLLYRVIYESYLRMCYLIKYGEEAQRKYRLKSYTNRWEFYNQYKTKGGYYKVRNDNFLRDIKDDGFTVADFADLKKEPTKTVKQLIEEFDQKEFYSYLYGELSGSIHSNWGEVRQIYLEESEKGEYTPSLYSTPNFRLLISMAEMLIYSSKQYIEWSRDKRMLPLLKEHERVISLINEYVVDKYSTVE